MSQTDAYRGLASLYDLLMDDVDYDAWLDFYLAQVRLPRGCRVADLACGTGAFALRLAKLGFAVTGVDISEQMLSLAQEKARAQGLRVQFVRQDMERLALPRPVTCLLCGCDGLNYLWTRTQLLHFFRRAHANLLPGGALLFDLSTYEKFLSMDGQLYGEDREEVSYLWFNALNRESRRLTMDLSFFVRQEDGRYRKFTERHVQAAHDMEELAPLLREAGFAKAQALEGPLPGRLYVRALRGEEP